MQELNDYGLSCRVVKERSELQFSTKPGFRRKFTISPSDITVTDEERAKLAETFRLEL